jgi:hypothetical protein
VSLGLLTINQCSQCARLHSRRVVTFAEVVTCRNSAFYDQSLLLE